MRCSLSDSPSRVIRPFNSSFRSPTESGDEKMRARTLEVVQASGFEPARLGDQAVAVNFLYLFTTTEVRVPGKRKTKQSQYLKYRPLSLLKSSRPVV